MERGYFIRLTPRLGKGLDQLAHVLNTIGINKYFICEEMATRLHYHACIYTTRSAESLRYQLKRYIQGEIYISGRDIEDQVKAIAYCMKDGVWKQNNMDVNTLLMAKTITRKKEKPYDAQFNELIEEATNYSERTLVSKIVDLNIKFNRKIYPQHISAQVRLAMAKAKPNYRDILVEQILRDLNY